MKRLSCIIAVALLAGCNVHSKSGDDDKVKLAFEEAPEAEVA